MYRNARSALLVILFLAVLSAPAAAEYAPYALRVNCGGGSYDTAYFGDYYTGDQGYSSGSPYGPKGGEIYGTDDDYLYQTHRYGIVNYAFDVPNGYYKVKLQFAETQAIRVGQRNLSAYIEGSRVVTNLDVYGKVGRDKTLDYEFIVQVSDGQLNIKVDRGNISWLPYSSMINAISITSTKPQSRGPVQVSGRGILVNGGGFLIKGICYQPAPIGEVPWGYDIFNDPAIYNRDFNILREMNSNAIRTWGKITSYAFLDAAYNGGIDPIYVIMGFHIDNSLDLSLQSTRDYVKNEFVNYVNAYKNHPAVLMWALGNQNNYFYPGDIRDFYSLIDELAWAAYEAEGAAYHPVAVVNGDIWDGNGPIGDPLVGTNDATMMYLDVWGVNVPPRWNFEGRVQNYAGRSRKPLWISEYGISGNYERNQAQAAYDLWDEMVMNSSICSGGTILEYSDEWWRSGDPGRQDDYGDDAEFLGVVAVEDNGSGPDIVHKKPAYYTLQEKWATGNWRNVARGNVASASSYEGAPYSAELAPWRGCDGNPATRWSSQFYDPQFIYVTLGATYEIGLIVLKWEAAYATAYEVQVSDDTENWTTVYSTTEGDGGTDFLYFEPNPVFGRYVRVYGTERAIPYGYSLWEIEVYEPMGDNLALGGDVSASSFETWSNNVAGNTFDGNPWSRWASESSDPQWISVDLGATYNIGKVALHWETAYASAYEIQVSGDAANWTTIYSTSTGDGMHDYITPNSTVSARYVRMYGIQRGTPWGYSLWEFEVFEAEVSNLASNKPASASSVESWGDYGPEKAFDGSLGTRWSSEDSDPQWIYVDLEAAYDITQVVLQWEAAYALEYEIQVSDDTIDWTSAYYTSSGDGDIDTIDITPSASGRYVRMYGLTRGTPWGYSLWEFEVYE